MADGFNARFAPRPPVFRTLACLPALTGAWAERGGGIAKSVASYTEGLLDEDAYFRPELETAGGRAEPRTLNMSRLGEILTSPTAGTGTGPGCHQQRICGYRRWSAFQHCAGKREGN